MESKIQEVVQVREYANSFGTTLYHLLKMDNGDMISIGKKKRLKEGDLLSYEWKDDNEGNHEYRSAQTLMLDMKDRKKFTEREDKGKFTEQSNDVQTSIIRQTCLKAACELYAQSSNNTPEEVLKAAEQFEKWVNR